MSETAPAVQAGQIWRSDSAETFFLVTEDGGNYYVMAHPVEPDPGTGHWRPVPGTTGRDTPEVWLIAYAHLYDRVERWLEDGPARLLSIDPKRHMDLIRRDGSTAP